MCKKILSLIYVTRPLSYHDPNFPMVVEMLVGMALEIKDVTSNSDKRNKVCEWTHLSDKLLNIIYLHVCIWKPMIIFAHGSFVGLTLPLLLGGGIRLCMAFCSYKKCNGLWKILKEEDRLHLPGTHILDVTFLNKSWVDSFSSLIWILLP